MFEIKQSILPEDYFIVGINQRTFLDITGTIRSHILHYWNSSEEAQDFLNKWLEIRNELFGNPYLEKEKMSDKMIDVRGKKISENTIVEALQKHCGFKDRPKQYMIEVRMYHGRPRVVIRLPDWAITRIKEKGIKSFVLDPMCISDSPDCSSDRNKDYTDNAYLSKQIEYAIGEMKDE